MRDKQKQVAGDHYSRMAIQPIDFIMENDLDYLQGNAVKYIVRHKMKGSPVDDLRKAIHYCEMMIDRELENAEKD